MWAIHGIDHHLRPVRATFEDDTARGQYHARNGVTERSGLLGGRQPGKGPSQGTMLTSGSGELDTGE